MPLERSGLADHHQHAERIRELIALHIGNELNRHNPAFSLERFLRASTQDDPPPNHY